MPVSSYSMTMRDHTRELASFTFPVVTVTAATLPGLLTAGGNFEAAVADVTLGVQAKRKVIAFENIDTALPTDGNAQREMAWVVHFRDVEEYFDAPTNSIFNENFGRPETIRIPTPNAGDTDLRQPNSDLADLTEQRWIDFIAAFEALALSKGGGDVQVEYIELSRGAK